MVRGGGVTPIVRGRPLVVGRGPSAQVRLLDPEVSAQHARLRLDEHGLWIEDLGSTNGTFVGELRIGRARLVLGVPFRVGRRELVVDVAPEARTVASIRIVGRAPPMRRLERVLLRLSGLRQPVMLRGESGTGKELAARFLHEASPRRGAAFVAINCAAVVDTLAESELFGHVRGAFTGAHRDHAGAFVRASGGTLFLDEVAELSPALQAKLLRVLETARVSAVGGERETAVDVRVVAATHRDLEAMVATGALREDLYHRLTVLVARIPPLRERREDIPLLLQHFASEAAAELGRPVLVSEDAVQAAVAHEWPGNVRALRNAVLRAGALCDGPIGPGDLVSAAPRPGTASSVVLPRGDYATMNRALLLQAVADHGSIRAAARALGIPRSTLGAWLRREPADAAPGVG
jgi:DNA-binding NtrC family response regulator